MRSVVVDRLQPLVAIAPLLDQAAQLLPYAQIMNVPPSTHNGQGDPVARSGCSRTSPRSSLLRPRG
jgi:hypothetical protein